MKIRAMYEVGILAAILASAGCRRSAAWPPEPAPLQFGEDSCAACSMIISDPSYAAEILDQQGKVQLYDDIGCMLAKSRPDTDPSGVFVRSADGTRWIRGDRAYLVRAGSITSPMGYGFVAFAELAAAETAAQAHGDAAVIELRTLLGSPRPMVAADLGRELTGSP